MATQIRLTKPWANHPPGTKFAVLAPGEDPAPGKVDPARAAALIDQKLAVNEGAARPASAAPAATKED